MAARQVHMDCGQLNTRSAYLFFGYIRPRVPLVIDKKRKLGMKYRIVATSIMFAAALSVPANAGETPSPEGAEVYFIDLSDGMEVTSPVTVKFGLKGMGVAPAGTEKEKTGHHHVLLNRPPLGEGEDGVDELEYGIPADENHIHFGGGQTETTLDLPPGTHTLQLVLGDLNHIPHNPPVTSEVITITVK